MQPMVGGQSASGGRSKQTRVQAEPIHFLLNSQMSIHGSEQGSSDDPVDEPDAAEHSEETAQQTRRKSQTPSSDNRQRSSGTFANSVNSGSKRKSTDEEPSVRGKRYREKVKKKKSEGVMLAESGVLIANKLDADTKAMMAADDEREKCVHKLRGLDFGIEEYVYCLNLLESSVKRKWFLADDREHILEIIRNNMRAATSESIPPPSTYAFNAAYHGFTSPNPSASGSSGQFFHPPNPAANNASSQFFHPPNPAASGYFFHPSDPSRDGNFM